MKVAVITGSRDWTDRAAIERDMANVDAVIVGCCPTGADAITLDVALSSDVAVFILAAGKSRVAELRAELKRRGATATVVQATEQTIRERGGCGPERNAAITALAVDFRDNLEADVKCYAYPLPNSRGTHDCARKLRAAGFNVETRAPVEAAEIVW